MVRLDERYWTAYMHEKSRLTKVKAASVILDLIARMNSTISVWPLGHIKCCNVLTYIKENVLVRPPSLTNHHVSTCTHQILGYIFKTPHRWDEQEEWKKIHRLLDLLKTFEMCGFKSTWTWNPSVQAYHTTQKSFHLPLIEIRLTEEERNEAPVLTFNHTYM
jgi:hypothetical protein